MEVIELSDSSEGEMASTSKTPAASPAMQQRCAQSVGYANAVEAALAMAAALETTKTKKSEPKKRNKKPAPPLLPAKSKKQQNNRRGQQIATTRRPKPVEKARRKPNNPQSRSTDARTRSSSLSSSSSSDSSSSSRFRPHPGRPQSAQRRSDLSGVKRRQNLEGQDRARKAPTESQKPVEVVDLMSSSESSSSSSGSSRSRSSSEFSMASSGGLTQATAKPGKKRLVLNDRVLGRGTPHPVSFSDQHAGMSSHLQGASNENDQASKLVATGKRKRALPHMRRESGKQGRAPINHFGKEKNKNKTSATSSVQGRNTAVTSSVSVTESASLSMSSSSASSSPVSSPKLVTARKSVTAPPTSSQTASRLREGDTDAFGRYHCRKRASTSVKPSAKSWTASKAAAPGLTPSSPSPPARKKRRVFNYFNMDSVALNDIQAQERELAWIRSQRKQAQNQSRPPNATASQERKTRREVIYLDDHSDANSAGNSEDAVQSDDHRDLVKTQVKCSDAVEGPPGAAPSDMLFHPTSYRGIYLDEAPLNILLVRRCSAPFDSDCNHPLTFYDDALARQCLILESFGKPTQCLSSVFPSEAAKPQSEVTRAVSTLVTKQLPIIRNCHRRKVRAILTEARQKILKYQVALRKHRRTRGGQEVAPHRLPRSAAEKYVVKQLKTIQYLSAGSVSFQSGCGDGFVREKSVSTLIQVNRLEEIRPLRRYTSSIGLRANYRVEDDPILKYTAITRPNGADGVSEMEKKYGLRMGNVADEEVVECILRLAVGSLGDSEQVFHALKSELDFSQAYTAYSELKKLHDSHQRAGARLDRVEALSHAGEQQHKVDADVMALINLMKRSSLSKASRARSLSGRLQPPVCNFESSFVDSVESATAGMSALGLRGAGSYDELVDVHCGFFCRMCYRYACNEHGGDHPLPARRVDPVYPRVRSLYRVASGDALAEDVAKSASSDDVACLPSEDSVELAREGDVGLSNDGSASHRRRQQQRKQLADPSDYVDKSHVSLVAAKMHSFLSTDNVCGEGCWKSGESKQHTSVPAAVLGVIRKLRETMGDNSCLLAAVVGSVSCTELHELIDREQTSVDRGASDVVGRSGRRMRNWKHGRRSGGSNHELLQRTRNQRLQDRGTENHEYEPCMHEGMCDSTGCSCMKRDHMCDKACACSRDCPNRFEGCTCPPNQCQTSKCPCFTALRECDPDVCTTCGASDEAVAAVMVENTYVDPTLSCGNVNVTRSKHKRLAMGFSSVHGFGMYAREAIAANEFVYEYTGAMLSQDEAERRGLIYDKMEMSYLFDLNEDAVLDALRSGNKSKFINHDGDTPNCTAKVVSVRGVHHIGIWTLRDIAVGEELVFDYGYKRSVGPDWSQRRAGSKNTS